MKFIFQLRFKAMHNDLCCYTRYGSNGQRTRVLCQYKLSTLTTVEVGALKIARHGHAGKLLSTNQRYLVKGKS